MSVPDLYSLAFLESWALRSVSDIFLVLQQDDNVVYGSFRTYMAAAMIKRSSWISDLSTFRLEVQITRCLPSIRQQLCEFFMAVIYKTRLISCKHPAVSTEVKIQLRVVCLIWAVGLYSSWHETKIKLLQTVISHYNWFVYDSRVLLVMKLVQSSISLPRLLLCTCFSAEPFRRLQAFL